MGNEQSSPTSPTTRRTGGEPSAFHLPPPTGGRSPYSSSTRRASTSSRTNVWGEPRKVSPPRRAPSASNTTASGTLQASAPVSRVPSRTSPQPSPQPAAPPPLPSPRVERSPPLPSQPAAPRAMPLLNAERPLSQISTGSGAPPPPYSPIDERGVDEQLVLEIAALMSFSEPGQHPAPFAEPGSEQDQAEEQFSTPQQTPLELPSPSTDLSTVSLPEQAPSSISRNIARPSSQRRHHSGNSSGSSHHRRTQSTSSHAGPASRQHRDRDLPPTPDGEGDADLPPTIRPHTIRPHASTHRPPTPPTSAGSRHTSFRVRSSNAAAPAPEAQMAEIGRETSHHSSRSRGSHHRRRSSHSAEDPLVLLKKYDTVILVDDSVSMADLWDEAKYALAEIAVLAAKYDIDGVDIHFVNDEKQGLNLKTAEAVIALFDSIEPAGQDSEIGGRLEGFLLSYLARAEKYQEAVELGTAGQLPKVRPVNYIVLTDGVPSDDPESVIVAAARRLDAHNFPLSQVGIQFVQLGDDPEATEVLQHLDDGLGKAYGIRDMVDWTLLPEGKLDATILTKILLGGINRRVDGKAGH